MANESTVMRPNETLYDVLVEELLLKPSVPLPAWKPGFWIAVINMIVYFHILALGYRIHLCIFPYMNKAADILEDFFHDYITPLVIEPLFHKLLCLFWLTAAWKGLVGVFTEKGAPFMVVFWWLAVYSVGMVTLGWRGAGEAFVVGLGRVIAREVLEVVVRGGR